MALVYGLRDGIADKNNERFQALSDEDKQRYHNILPFAMMCVDIGRITPNTIKPLLKRLEFLGMEDMVQKLPEEFLQKVLGFTVNVNTIPLAKDWLNRKAWPTTGSHYEMSIFHKEEWKDHPYSGEKDHDEINERNTVFLILSKEWADEDLRIIGKKRQPKTPGEKFLWWMLYHVRSMQNGTWSEKDMIQHLEHHVSSLKTTWFETEIVDDYEIASSEKDLY
jgi:hypothetical protein